MTIQLILFLLCLIPSTAAAQFNPPPTDDAVVLQPTPVPGASAVAPEPLTTTTSPPEPGRSNSSPVPHKTALFIGNSLTFTHDIPGLVERLSAGGPAQERIIATRSTFPGVTLEWHLNEGNAQALIQSKPWDFIIIQEQSGMTRYRMASTEYPVRTLAELIHARGSRGVLYSIASGQWTRAQQDVIDQFNARLARKYDLALASVSKAWRAALERRLPLDVYGPDNHHPGYGGAFLAAAVLYRSMLQHAPAVLPLDLPPEGPMNLWNLIWPKSPLTINRRLAEDIRKLPGIGFPSS